MNRVSRYRQLVKNLMVGYFSAPKGKQTEVLHLIAKVLHFSNSESEKLGLTSPPSWVGGLWQKLTSPNSPSRSNSQPLDQVCHCFGSLPPSLPPSALHFLSPILGLANSGEFLVTNYSSPLLMIKVFKY